MSNGATLTAVLKLGFIIACCFLFSNSEASGRSSGTDAQREPLTLTWLVPGVQNVRLPDEKDDFVLRAIESKFHVDLKLSYTTLDSVGKQNSMLAVSPPDMWYNQGWDGGQGYYRDGLLAELTPYITRETMPNYFKYWIKESELHEYGVLEGQFVRAQIPYNRNAYRAYYIRSDWLNRLGMEIPSTYEEYLDVLRAFRHDDPDGNGKKDTYGFSLSAGGTSLGFDWPEYVKNGFPYGGHVQDGRWVESGQSLEMALVIDDILRVLEEDIVDPDWFLNRGNQHIEKAIQGKIGVVLLSQRDAALDANVQSLQQRSRQLNPRADWVPFTMFPGVPLRSESKPGQPFLFAKSVAEQSPEKVQRTIEILDWLAGQEGFLLTHYGLEGKHYTQEGDKIVVKYDRSKVDESLSFLKIWSFFTPNTPEAVGLSVINPYETDRDRAIQSYLQSMPLLPYVGTPLIAPVSFDLTAFRNQQQQYMLKALFEDRSNVNWPQYLEKILYQHGGAELSKVYEEQIRAVGTIK